MKWTAVDLFAGAGGATQGLKNAGFSVLAAIELDAAAGRTFSANHPEVLPFWEDIASLSPSAIRKCLELERGALTLLKACPPCQGFSTLGAGAGDDARNDIVAEVWRFLRDFRPKVFVVENVPGLKKDRRFERLLRQSRSVGYSVRTYVVDAANFGVPQRRRRLIAIGLRGGSQSRFPEQLASAAAKRMDVSPRPADEAIAMAGLVGESADSLHRVRQTTAAVRRRIAAVPIGGTRFDLPKEHRLACHDRLEGRRATASYGRIRIGQVAPTMTTRCTTAACGSFIHPTENRAITLREAALLQTFPPSYRFDGTHAQIERQIGNALPVKLAEALGWIVRDMLGDEGGCGTV